MPRVERRGTLNCEHDPHERGQIVTLRERKYAANDNGSLTKQVM